MEKYFDHRSKLYYENKPIKEIKPEINFQVGATPEFTEKCRDNKNMIDSFSADHKCATPMPPPYDAKWRYFWNIRSNEK